LVAHHDTTDPPVLDQHGRDGRALSRRDAVGGCSGVEQHAIEPAASLSESVPGVTILVGIEARAYAAVSQVMTDPVERLSGYGSEQAQPAQDIDAGGEQALAAGLLSRERRLIVQFHADAPSSQ
jgi:hypothetical protein